MRYLRHLPSAIELIGGMVKGSIVEIMVVIITVLAMEVAPMVAPSLQTAGPVAAVAAILSAGLIVPALSFTLVTLCKEQFGEHSKHSAVAEGLSLLMDFMC